jgi:hypothetical protein
MTQAPAVLNAQVLLAELESRIIDISAAARVLGDGVMAADGTVLDLPDSAEPPD